MRNYLTIGLVLVALSLTACAGGTVEEATVAAPVATQDVVEVSGETVTISGQGLATEDQGILDRLEEIDCKTKSFERKEVAKGGALRITLEDCTTTDLDF